MIRCPTKKKTYTSAVLAEDALIEAHITYDYADARGPVGIYRCEECGFYHLTSQGLMNPRLAEALRSGAINRQKEANRWSKKATSKTKR